MMVLFLLLLPSFLHGQGYHVVGERCVVEGIEDWRAWDVPKRAAILAPDGSVRPFRVRRETDPMEDAGEYVHRVSDDKLEEFPFRRLWESGLGTYSEFYIASGGIKNAGSSLEGAWHVLDGDTATYWAPDPSDSLSSWWIELDLGRAVTVTRILFRFGEPFKRFKVQISNGSSMGIGASAFDWRQVYRSRRMVEEDRIFEIALAPSLERMEGDGDVVQYIRIQATDWTDKGKEVSNAEYEALPSGRQGLREYFRKTARGGVRMVSQEAYEKLPTKLRGMIRYYVKPQPSLVEVEVYAVGDNIAIGLMDRGGSVDNPATKQPTEQRSAVDGSFVSNLRLTPDQNRPVQLVVDLGATFWTDDIRLIMDRDPTQVVTNLLSSYRIEGSDGTRAVGDELAWEVLTPDDRLNLPDGMWRTQDAFELRKTRYIRVTFFNTITEFYGNAMFLREVQVYGEGYAPDVTLESPVMDLGPHRAISFVRWRGDIPPSTGIEIRTRSGDRMKQITRYFDIDGNEVTELRWHKLPGFLRGGSVPSEEPGEDWSTWSAPYAYVGELIRSPTPSRYVQFQVRLVSDDRETFAAIQSLSFDTFPPLVHRVVGEILPEDAARAGEWETFTLLVKLSAVPTDLGFDEFVLTSPYRPRLVLESLRMASEEEVLDAPELSEDDFELVPTGPDSIYLRFPRRILPVREQMLAIRFSSSILRKGTRLYAYLQNRSLPETPQEIRPGDATVLSDTQTMTVGVPVDRKVLGRLRVHPNPFTPNGDGINDVLQVAFQVFNVYPLKAAEVRITDLRGYILRRLAGGETDADGLCVVRWDGRDEAGDRVSPGIYLARVGEVTAAQEATRTAACKAIYVAY